MFAPSPSDAQSLRKVGRFSWGLALAWVLVAAASYAWSWNWIHRDVQELARTEARVSGEKDFVIREWSMQRGSVYVPPSASTPPNPYLSVPNRDVTTTTGLRLTLMNPEYILRQVHELGGQAHAIPDHLTSLDPLRPENAPDEWERSALKTLEAGAPEASGVVVQDGQRVMRIMRPLLVESRCIGCHGSEHYKVGDIRGGLSLAVPLAPFEQVMNSQLRWIGATHVLLCGLGLLGIRYGRKQLRAHLMTEAATKARLSAIIEMEPECVKVLGPDGMLVHMNRAGLNIIDAESFDQVAGKSMALLVDEPYRQAFRDLFKTVMNGGSGTLLFSVTGLKGRHVWLETHAVPFRDERGAITGLLGVTRDVTERARLEEQLRQSQKIEAIGQLAGGIAHDFNNILSAMTMRLELLEDRADIDEDTRETAFDLKGDVARAANLTRQLLMFGRRSLLQVRPLNLNDVVANFLKLLGRLIGEHIHIHFHGPSMLPAVDADAGMLEQVLMNLSLNARDAMPGGGNLTLSTDVVDVADQDVPAAPARRSGRFVTLSVSDSGTGMTDDTKARLFEPFFTTKQAGRGTGLGLATTYGIVRQHGGWIEVESRVGEGSRFTVFLPASRARSADSTTAAAPNGRPAPNRGSGETILVVEDEPEVRHMLTEFLSRQGYRVLDASNGPQALEIWATEGAGIALVLTDMVMPGGVTGLELVGRLRADRPDIKIIITSGYTQELVPAAQLSEQGLEFLQKPWKPSALAATIREMLSGTQAG